MEHTFDQKPYESIEIFINIQNLMKAAGKDNVDLFLLFNLLAWNRMFTTIHTYLQSNRDCGEHRTECEYPDMHVDMTEDIIEHMERSDCDTMLVICGDGGPVRLIESAEKYGKDIEFADFSRYLGDDIRSRCRTVHCLDSLPIFKEECL